MLPQPNDDLNDDASHPESSSLVCRNVTILDRRTSIRIEPKFWQWFQEIARAHHTTVHQIATDINRRRFQGTLTSAIRTFICAYFVRLELDRLNGRKPGRLFPDPGDDEVWGGLVDGPSVDGDAEDDSDTEDKPSDDVDRDVASGTPAPTAGSATATAIALPPADAGLEAAGLEAGAEDVGTTLLQAVTLIGDLVGDL